MFNSENSTPEYIVWTDIETTGLSPFNDYILEVGAVVSDMTGISKGTTFSSVVNYDNFKEILSCTNDKVKEMHSTNGLLEDIWMNKGDKIEEVDKNLYKWINDITQKDCGRDAEECVIYFGGRSITLDRNFLQLYCPKSYSLYSHKSMDMTGPTVMMTRNNLLKDKNAYYRADVTHRALQDSIDCLEQYRDIVVEMKNSKRQSD